MDDTTAKPRLTRYDAEITEDDTGIGTHTYAEMVASTYGESYKVDDVQDLIKEGITTYKAMQEGSNPTTWAILAIRIDTLEKLLEQMT